MSSITWHPVLEHFVTRFMNRDPVPSGIRVGNMDDFVLSNGLNLEGSYLACAKSIEFNVAEVIRCTGPGGGLIAAHSLELESPEIVFEGDEEDPIQLVGIQNISVKATDLKIKNVVFYLFDNANFAIKASSSLVVENVKVVRLSLDNQTILQEDVAHWKDDEALRSFISRQNVAEKPQESLEEFLERLKWQREIVREMGLRSILI